MVQLTSVQARALAAADGPLEVQDPLTQQTYILIRRDVYDLVQSWVRTFNRAGWDDPALDVYEEYRNKS